MKQGPERELVARYLERAIGTGRPLGLTGFETVELNESRAGSAAARKAEEAKAKKDLQQSATLIQILAQSRPEELKSAWEEAIARGPTWRELLTAGAAQLPASAKDSLADAGIVGAAKPSSRSVAT